MSVVCEVITSSSWSTSIAQHCVHVYIYICIYVLSLATYDLKAYVLKLLCYITLKSQPTQNMQIFIQFKLMGSNRK